MINPMQNEITFPEGWFLFINGEIPFYCDCGCTVADFAAAGKLIGYNKKNGIYFKFAYESTGIKGFEPPPGIYVLTIRKYNYTHNSGHFGRCIYAEVKQTQCPKEFKNIMTDMLNMSAEQSTFEEVKRPKPQGKCTPQLQQCIHDFFTGVKKDRTDEIMTLIRSPMDKDEEDILYLRKLYYGHDESPYQRDDLVKSEINKKVVSEIHRYFDSLDKTRKLENGRDLFSFLFSSKKYDISIIVPKNVSLCDVFMSMSHLQDEKIM
ncbi:hypothetical protein KKI90_08310 [Xenorhabdus bovienii]|uniref:Uncharacterized protein n=1 Tax=Xenorhabdus bovienii str. kraussei Becker Underwood TaxID=1398204 RepID=A0A077PNQ9_XENBV|nr:hypothetical protein [Xenorhabdus bovienii]MDE1486267.1 hypothetical protein [Xenorhabdus bovienii]MDE1496136.1 hypothetical protein [Xenorhabdus bovienii]MDE9472832.1 hypothetical protein [Xenorhabdus bovienii]MDE9477006.1 hypothetical protein [Xenorhabdus bovienii]MDE9529939.1 hypothetical protein [Xenorhabdus bovienii]